MPSRSSVSAVGAALIALLVAAGCGGESEEADESATLQVYVSLPLQGATGADGRDAADGARLALSDADSQAGGVEVEASFLDDTEGSGPRARWSPAKAAANARVATQESAAIAYLGDFESGATRASLPITNEARLLQVSPASSAVDLVAPFPGTDEMPETQPGAERSFGRVIPADDAQGAAAAAWAVELGAGRAAIVDDRTPFGRDLASGFSTAAERIGLELPLAGGSLTYLAGVPSSRGGREIGSDAYLTEPAAPAGPRMLTSAALDPAQLPPAAGDFAAAFEQAYDRAPGRYAAYGYEAMALILDSIDRASDPFDRSAVVDAFFETSDRESILGTYSIDEVGDTTLDRMTGYELDRGRLEPVAELRVP